MADKEKREFTRQELQDILDGKIELSRKELSKIFGGYITMKYDPMTGKTVPCGDDRKSFTRDQREIEKDIFGSKMFQ